MSSSRFFLALVLALCVASAGAASSPGPASLLVTFDNRGSKVMGATANAKIMAVLAQYVFQVPPSQVVQVSGEGRSNIVNHKSSVTYAASGPTTNGRTPLENCVAASKSGWISSSTIKKEIKKATDTWMPGDSVEVDKAQCSEFKAAPGVAAKAAPGVAAGGRPVGGRNM